MVKKILYVGNNFTKNTKYYSSMETLSSLLPEEGYKVIKTSDKKSKIIRLFDMCLTLIRNRKVDYVLIDVFSTSAFYFSFIISQISRVLNKKYILILRGGNLPIRLKKSPRLLKMMFNNSYKNVAPSNYLKSIFISKKYDVLYIPNTIDIKKYKFKRRVKISPKILWVRSFRELYNPQLAIKVFKRIKNIFPESNLCMVGPAKDSSFEKTVALVKKLKLQNSVEFTGVLSREEWHKKAEDFDVFINTTNVDNTPVSVIEAMALGLPVISTNVGGVPFLVKDDVDGILVDKNNVDQMFNAIQNLILKDSEQLTLKARLKAESFSWDVIKHKWKEILK